jgi:DNA-directed RNA polymerase subunit RPC12/RpoP
MKRCKYCNKIIVEDFLKWLEENKDKYIQCPYCGELEQVRFVE